jgi:hypothetical protein
MALSRKNGMNAVLKPGRISQFQPKTPNLAKRASFRLKHRHYAKQTGNDLLSPDFQPFVTI